MNATVDLAIEPARPLFPYDGPEELRIPIERALARVVDPEVAMNIVDVGLVYAVRVAEGQVRVLVTMTSAACPVVDVIVDDIWHELSRVVPESVELDVDLVWEPPWTSDRMSDRAKRTMGW
jgi:metal-sulfur cluster biosynthetic enzyme